VRLEAIKGLVRHPSPQDYEHLRSLLPLSSPETQGVIAQALLASDAEQAIADFCTWFAHGELSATWLVLVAQASRASAPETLTRLRALVPQAKNEFPLYLNAALASHGERKALEALRAALRDASAGRAPGRAAGLRPRRPVEELAPVLNGDADASLRARRAADRIAHAPDAPLLRSALTHGLADQAREVRKICLAALVERGDGDAQDLALTLLAGDKSDLEDALGALREPWRRDEALARRALEILLALRHGERPLRVEPRALDRALALVPLREAALELYQSAVSETAPIGTFSAHGWYTHQIGNAGAAGAAFLRERWKLEPDALRRLDLCRARSTPRTTARATSCSRRSTTRARRPARRSGSASSWPSADDQPHGAAAQALRAGRRGPRCAAGLERALVALVRRAGLALGAPSDRRSASRPSPAPPDAPGRRRRAPAR
jgi:hypothetical protein